MVTFRNEATRTELLIVAKHGSALPLPRLAMVPAEMPLKLHPHSILFPVNWVSTGVRPVDHGSVVNVVGPP